MAFDSSRFRRHELGFFLPPSVELEPAASPVGHVATYLTYRDLMDSTPPSRSELVDWLNSMSAADCLLQLAHTRFESG
jgi:hypothetical protein